MLGLWFDGGVNEGNVKVFWRGNCYVIFSG